jgi:SAM-dependent methyltransferase
LPLLEKEKDKAKKEVRGLCSIFNKFDTRKGSRILDLSCGIGRHAIHLAKKGFQVIGYDPSEFYLDIARQWAEKEKSKFSYTPKFYKGKPGKASQVLSKHNETNFDVIINMWQSFGYTTVDEDVKFFRDVLKVASPDCMLIIEAQNRDWTIRNFQPFIIHVLNELNIFETWKFNFERSIFENISNFYKRDQNNGNLCFLLNLPTTMIVYSLHELIRILGEAGWRYIASYGSLESLQPVSLESQKLITINRSV